MEWLAWLKELKDTDPKLFPPLVIMGLGIYLLLARRIKAVETRMATVEASTATIAGIHRRLDDFFELVKQTLGMEREERDQRPSYPIVQASAADELRLRELARATLEGRRDR